MLFNHGDETIEAKAGNSGVGPAGTPHKFLSRGATHRHISIHPVARKETQWIETTPPPGCG